jgi:ubiquinone/menaquinone biosynthesis C-methylase UbiE
LGCGVGGPAREICRFSRVHVTGINNNAHQIQRAQQITAESGKFVAERCSFVQSDFMKLPFSDETYDHAYAIEATCHAPVAADCYREIARCIKPGGMFVCYEWVRACPSSFAALSLECWLVCMLPASALMRCTYALLMPKVNFLGGWRVSPSELSAIHEKKS